MANNSNKFDLNKTGKKKFDLNKGANHKFDLSKDNDEPVVVASSDISSKGENNADNKNNKKWLFIIGILVIIALIVYGISKCSGKQVVETSTTLSETTGVNTVPTSETDEVTTQNTPVSSESTNIEEPIQENAPTASKNTPTTSINDNALPPISNIEEKALLVIRGNFGNGEERKAKLGAEYSAIQSKVNEMYANGLVH